MKVKLKFHGPNIVSCVTRTEPIPIHHAVSFEVELAVEKPTLEHMRAIWEIERTFNALTKGRLHVDIIDDGKEVR